ncbi:MAG: 23S rRNA (adenine(2030)-N(6))-methyltransferase RlmJ [Betaproteobacteria bacterium]|nr:23S rRNA (adenine(2030)-N(6))-methyltransferase RlmJ [Betaproteobacteria bacterium]
MFSYRHAFHAGNHADVLKHTCLIAIQQYLNQKDTALTILDTHAGAGLYRLDGDYAQTSRESAQGVHKLLEFSKHTALAPALQNYLELVLGFNTSGSALAAKLRVYPGSPFIIQRLMRGADRLKLFEMHPTDFKALSGNVKKLDAGRQVAVFRSDGFEGIRTFLPPPARRALLLCDPSYEIKSDYPKVVEMVTEALKRFATGTYAVWHPIIPRMEAHDLPRKLKTLANKSQKSWLHATLTVKSSGSAVPVSSPLGEATPRPGLPASGLIVINPPHTLKAMLQEALPQMVLALGQDRHASMTLETS